MNKRPKRKATGYQTRYAKDDQSKEDKVAYSEQIPTRKGKTLLEIKLLNQSTYPKGEREINTANWVLITAKRGLHLPVSRQKTTEK